MLVGRPFCEDIKRRHTHNAVPDIGILDDKLATLGDIDNVR